MSKLIANQKTPNASHIGSDGSNWRFHSRWYEYTSYVSGGYTGFMWMESEPAEISLRSVADVERIEALEKERDELKAHTVALEIDFDNALDIAQLCANNPSVVDANKSFQDFVSYTTIESTLEAHNLEQQATACDWVYKNAPDLSNGNYMVIQSRARQLRIKAKALKETK